MLVGQFKPWATPPTIGQTAEIVVLFVRSPVYCRISSLECASQMKQSLSEILLTLYAADDLEDLRRRALGVVEREFGGELTCHNEINLVSGDSLSVLSQSISRFETLRPAFFEHVEQHPSVQHTL